MEDNWQQWANRGDFHPIILAIADETGAFPGGAVDSDGDPQNEPGVEFGEFDSNDWDGQRANGMVRGASIALKYIDSSYDEVGITVVLAVALAAGVRWDE